ncbi:MAG: tryptophan-rich sensory protein [Myxococcaceae bacterium]|nr:tryptophan-rich sensory protein [Myxococcaceae bacterium]
MRHLVFGVLVACASLIGAKVSRRAPKRPWYRALRKAPWNPPPKVFGIVWPVLYALMAVSGARAWKRRDRAAVALWGAQLGFNAAWSPLFFGAHRSRAALVDLGLTFASASAYTARVARTDKAAAVMMSPYLAWLAFAATLNGAIVAKNPRLLAG